MSSRVVFQGVIRRCQAPLLLLFLLAPSPGRGDGGGTGPEIALADLVALALRDNPALRASRAGWEAGRERPGRERALPNPMFLYGGMDDLESFSFPDTDEKRFEIEQTFPWFGKRGLGGRIAEKEAEISGTDHAALERDLVMQVKDAYYTLYAIQGILAITWAEEGVLDRMRAAAAAQFETGGAGLDDALEAETEITLWKARLLDLERDRTIAAARLNRLIGRDPGAPIGRAVTPPPQADHDPERLLALARETRPEIETARARIGAGDLRVDLAQRAFYPDYRLGVEYRSLDGADDMAMFRVGIDLPIWRGKYGAGVRGAELELEASRAALEDAEVQTAYEVREAYAAWDTARRARELYESALLPQAEARFQASEAAYRTGRADFQGLLESERLLLNARVLLVTKEMEIGVQLARLERAVGTELAADPAREE